MNKAILCGRMTNKPELRYTGTNTPYCRFTLAVDRPKIQDKEQETDFINCISWGKQSETIAKYFDKGHKILINGRIQTGKYTDKDGNNRNTTDIVVEEFDFIEKKQSDPFQDFGDMLE